MAELVTVTVKAEHGNSFGDNYQKKVGRRYDCPPDYVPSLVRDGMIDDPTPAKAKGTGAA